MVLYFIKFSKDTTTLHFFLQMLAFVLFVVEDTVVCFGQAVFGTENEPAFALTNERHFFFARPMETALLVLLLFALRQCAFWYTNTYLSFGLRY